MGCFDYCAESLAISIMELEFGIWLEMEKGRLGVHWAVFWIPGFASW